MNIQFAEPSGRNKEEIPSPVLHEHIQMVLHNYILAGSITQSLRIKPGIIDIDIAVNLVHSTGGTASDNKFGINPSSVSDKLITFEKDCEMFETMREELRKQYPGQYVAIYRGKVVDSDPDDGVLIDRFYEKYGNVPFCLGNPEEEEVIEEVLTPVE